MNQYTIELQERIINLVKSVIKTLQSINITVINKNIISQLLKSITSIGANYQEALESESREDFVHKLSICKKEARESMYWFDILQSVNPESTDLLHNYSQETTELVKIFASSIAAIKRQKKNI